MRMKQTTTSITPAYLNQRQLADFLGVGVVTAAKVGQQAGARRRIGARVLYDRAAIEQYMNTVAKEDAAEIAQ